MKQQQWYLWIIILAMISINMAPIANAQTNSWRELTRDESGGLSYLSNDAGVRAVALEADGVTKYGVVSTDGRLIIPATIPHLMGISIYDNEIQINTDIKVVGDDVRYGRGIITYNFNGKETSRTDIYTTAYGISDGIRLAYVNNSNGTYVDSNWNKLEWGDVQKLPSKGGFKNGSATVGNGTGSWYVDTTGKTMFNGMKWTSTSNFEDAHAMVGYEVQGRIFYGMIDSKGVVVLPMKYDHTDIEYIAADGVFKVYEPANRNFNVTGKDQYTGGVIPSYGDEDREPTYYKRTNGRTEDVTGWYKELLDQKAEAVGTGTYIFVKLYKDNEIIKRTTSTEYYKEILKSYIEVFGKPVEVSEQEWKENGAADTNKAFQALQQNKSILTFPDAESLEKYLFEIGKTEQVKGKPTYWLMGYEGFETKNGYPVAITYSEMQKLIKSDPVYFALSGPRRFNNNEFSFRVITPMFNSEGKEFDAMAEDLLFKSMDELLLYFKIDGPTNAQTTGDNLVAKVFKDTKGHWAEKTITKWSKYQIITGTPVGDFKPNASITRAEFCAIMLRLLSIEEKTRDATEIFTDIKASDWFAEAVGKAYDQGLVTDLRKYEHLTKSYDFHPNQAMTREELARALTRLYGIDESSKSSFKDAKDISIYNLPSINTLYEAGIIEGAPDGKFNPRKPVTRAQMLTILDKMIKHYVVNEETLQLFMNDKSDMSKSISIINFKREGDIVLKDKKIKFVYVTPKVKAYIHTAPSFESYIVKGY